MHVSSLSTMVLVGPAEVQGEFCSLISGANFLRVNFLRVHWFAEKSASTSTTQEFSRKTCCGNPRGLFPSDFPGEFCREGFFEDCFGLLFSGKTQKNNIHSKINNTIQIRIWELCGQRPHCKDLPLTIRAQNFSVAPKFEVLFWPTFRAKNSGPSLVNFSRFFPPPCGKFSQFSMEMSQN